MVCFKLYLFCFQKQPAPVPKLYLEQKSPESPYALYFLLDDKKRAYMKPVNLHNPNPRKRKLVAIKKEKAEDEDYQFFLPGVLLKLVV